MVGCKLLHVGVAVNENCKTGMKKQVGKCSVFTKDNLPKIQDKMREKCIISFNKVYGLNAVLKEKQKGRNIDYRVNQMEDCNELKKNYSKQRQKIKKLNNQTNKLNNKSKEIKDIINNLKNQPLSNKNLLLSNKNKDLIPDYMIDVKLKKVFELSERLQEKYNRKLYDELSTIDENIEPFEEFLENQKYSKAFSSESKKRLNDAYISKDTINKDNIVFSLYLFYYNHTDPIELDENYKPLPLKERKLYEYGAVVSMEDETGYYNISGVFGGIKDNLELSKQKYNSLKEKIKNTSNEDLLDEIEDKILKEMN